MQKAKNLNDKQRAALLKLLQERFEENKRRHPGLQWAKVQAKLVADPWLITHNMETLALLLV